VLRVSEAGRNTGLHPAVLYRRLNALAAAGLATRARDTSGTASGTVVLVALTPKAEAALDTWFADATAAAGWPLL
jgi:DNA-binding MarR family transcriptional regulator